MPLLLFADLYIIIGAWFYCNAVETVLHSNALITMMSLTSFLMIQVVITPEDYAMFSLRPQALVANFIKTRLQKDV